MIRLWLTSGQALFWSSFFTIIYLNSVVRGHIPTLLTVPLTLFARLFQVLLETDKFLSIDPQPISTKNHEDEFHPIYQ